MLATQPRAAGLAVAQGPDRTRLLSTDSTTTPPDYLLMCGAVDAGERRTYGAPERGDGSYAGG